MPHDRLIRVDVRSSLRTQGIHASAAAAADNPLPGAMA